MKTLRIIAAGVCALAILLAGAALAQTSPAPGTTVDFGPVLVQIVMPAVGIIVSALAAWGVKKLADLAGIKADEKAIAVVNDVMQKGLAFATSKIGTIPLKVDVRSPVIADAASYALAHGPDALKRLGISPEQLAEKLVARYIDPSVPVGVTTPRPPAAAA